MTKLRLKYIHEYRASARPHPTLCATPWPPQGAIAGRARHERVHGSLPGPAIAGETPRPAVGASRTEPGSVNAAVVSYYGSAVFANLAPGTRRQRRYLLERFRAEHGDKRVALLQRDHIDHMVAAAKAATPSAAKIFLQTVHALMAHCIAARLRDDDPTVGVKSAKTRSAGIHTWTEDDIAAFEKRHPVGSPARLALGLLLFTGQRRSDVIRMGRQHVRDGVLHVTQQKTGAALAIPLRRQVGRHHRSDAERASDVSGHPRWLAVQHRRLWQPVSCVVRSGGIEALFRAWSAQSRLPPARRERVPGSRDHGDQRPRHVARGAARPVPRPIRPAWRARRSRRKQPAFPSRKQ